MIPVDLDACGRFRVNKNILRKKKLASLLFKKGHKGENKFPMSLFAPDSSRKYCTLTNFLPRFYHIHPKMKTCALMYQLEI